GVSSSSVVVPSSPVPSSDPRDIVRELRSLDPCSLLTEDEVAEFGDFKEPKYKEFGKYPTCGWFPDRGEEEGYSRPSINTVLREDLTIEEIKDSGSGIDHGQMDSGRDFTRSGASGEYIVALAVGEEARAEVLVTGVD